MSGTGVARSKQALSTHLLTAEWLRLQKIHLFLLGSALFPPPSGSLPSGMLVGTVILKCSSSRRKADFQRNGKKRSTLYELTLSS